MRTLLEQQYAALADWLDEVPVSAHLVEPVGLGDWTVRELVAHLGLGIGLSRYVAAAEPGALPLSLGEYVSAYPPASDQIAEMTRRSRRGSATTWSLGSGVRRPRRSRPSTRFRARCSRPGADR